MRAMTVAVEAFEQLGSCVIAIDGQGVIVWASEKLERLLGAPLVGMRPRQCVVKVDCSLVGFGLRRRDGAVLPLRGDWVASRTDRMRVFVGAPAPGSTEEMTRLGITIDDFRLDDPWLNYLVRADECAATQGDARKLMVQLRAEREELAKARDEMRDARRAALDMMNDVEQAQQKAERANAELQAVQRQLVEASRLAGMSEVAVDVLHNVGNVLNSMNVSAGLIDEMVRESRSPGLRKACALLAEHTDDLAAFMTIDTRGRELPGYLSKLAECLTDEQTDVLEEVRRLTDSIDHIKTIVSTQQSLTGVSGAVEDLTVARLLDDLLHFDTASLERHRITVLREYEAIPSVKADRHKMTQILVNLLRNAKDALAESEGVDRRLTVRLRRRGAERVLIEVADNGVGIPSENLTRIFTRGFTTKRNGHGFGLHGSALTAGDMGGSLTATSDGPGKGAVFVLEFPLKPPARPDERSALQRSPLADRADDFQQGALL